LSNVHTFTHSPIRSFRHRNHFCFIEHQTKRKRNENLLSFTGNTHPLLRKTIRATASNSTSLLGVTNATNPAMVASTIFIMYPMLFTGSIIAWFIIGLTANEISRKPIHVTTIQELLTNTSNNPINTTTVLETSSPVTLYSVPSQEPTTALLHMQHVFGDNVTDPPTIDLTKSLPAAVNGIETYLKDMVIKSMQQVFNENITELSTAVHGFKTYLEDTTIKPIKSVAAAAAAANNFTFFEACIIVTVKIATAWQSPQLLECFNMILGWLLFCWRHRSDVVCIVLVTLHICFWYFNKNQVKSTMTATSSMTTTMDVPYVANSKDSNTINGNPTRPPATDTDHTSNCQSAKRIGGKKLCGFLKESRNRVH
jgi:hypothetical protein